MKFKPKLLLLQALPIAALSAIVVLLSIVIVRDEVSLRIEETLGVAVDGYSGDVFYLKDMGYDIELTVFDGDVRVDSSISGAVGTRADREITDIVVNGRKPYFTTNVTVNGERYFGYYKPYGEGMLFAGKPRAAVVKLLTVITSIIAGVTVVLLCICMVVTGFVADRMARMLSYVRDDVIGMSNFNFTDTQYIGPGSARVMQRLDEFGDLFRALYRLKRNLFGIIDSIRKQSVSLNEISSNFSERFRTIDESIGQVNSAMEEVAQGSTLQAGEVTNVSNEIAGMGDVVASGMGDAESLEAIVLAMEEFLDKAKDVLSSLSNAVTSMSDSIMDVSRQIDVTNGSVEKIRSAIEMIQDIVGQTNLLSINASIEAAHAGERGKGFAVVADEIKKLSESSSTSAQAVKSMADEILDNSSGSVEKMSVVTGELSVQREQFDAMLSAFDTLESEVMKVKQASASMSAQMVRLNQQKDNISGSSEQLSSISQENAASSQEVSASMQTLAGIVMECGGDMQALVDAGRVLDEQVSKFKF